MPKSRLRRKFAYTQPPTRSPSKRHSGPLLVPAMLALLLLGVLWLVVYYVSNGEAPVMSALGNWNLLVGFGFIIAGFALATRWR